METIKQVLMRRDGITEEEANDVINEARFALEDVLNNGGGLEDAEDICSEYFGLEPDYLMELMDF